MAPRGADATERSLGIKTSPVYTRTTDPDRYLRGNATNQQEMRKADAGDKIIADRYGVVKTDIRTPAQIAADKALQEPTAFTSAVTGFNNSGGGAPAGPKYGDLTDRMKLTETGRQFDISTAADKAQNDIVNGLNQAQFDLQKATTAQGRADAKAKYDALKNYYDSGEWKSGYDELNTMLTDNYNTGVTGLQGTYDRAQANLGAGYDLAKGLTDQGYSALQNYLQQNPNNAFAGLQQQVAAEQLAGQQGAGAFNTLADILNRNSQQSNSSRMAEMQMAQTMANAGLGANRANYQARNAEAQAQALAQLQQQLAQNQFGVQQNQMQAGNAALQAILNATGDFGNDGTGNGGTGNGGTGNDGTVYNDLVERNPGPVSGIDESTRVPEVTPDILEALRRSLAGLGAGFGQGFLAR